MSIFPSLVRSVSPSGELRYALGHPLVDRYLEFVAGRCRPNTLTATAFDLKTFFTVVRRDPVAVSSADVFEFLATQRGDRRVVRISDRESGLSARTIARRLSTVSGFYAYLVARGDTAVVVNPVPRGLATRRRGGAVTSRTVPLVRVPRTLPKILSPLEVDASTSRIGGCLSWTARVVINAGRRWRTGSSRRSVTISTRCVPPPTPTGCS
jgi:integrase/recombinase XerD